MPAPLVKLAYVAITTAASTLAAKLLAPKTPKAPLDDSRTEPSARGTLLGTLMGHYRVGPVIGYVGDRRIRKQTENHAAFYREDAWHIINNGQGRSLRRIYKDGKAIWQGDITPDTHPSGSSVSMPGSGSFTVYWGETDQPINESLSDQIGVRSRWPGTFYIWWDYFHTGSTGVWPTLEYEITCEPLEQGISGDSFFSFGGSGYDGIPFYTRTKRIYQGRKRRNSYLYYTMRVVGEDTVPDLVEGMDVNVEDGSGEVIYRAEVTGIVRSGGYTTITVNNALPLALFNTTTTTTGWYEADFPFNSDAFIDMGANPAFVISSYLFSPKPFGAGLSRSMFDSSLQDISDLMTSEEVPCTSLLRSGRSWKDGIASIMQDMGILFVLDSETGLYGFRAMRDGATISQIGEDDYDLYRMSSTYAYSVLASDSRVFKYKDSSRNFADSTIMANKDSFAVHGADPNVKTINLETITSYTPASKVAARRDAEESLDGATLVETAYPVNPAVGSAVTLEGIDELYRVASVKTNPAEAKRDINLLPDAYITGGDYTTVLPQGLNPSSRTSVSPDAIFQVLETNRFNNPDVNGYYVPRIRFNTRPSSAIIYDSADGVSYAQAGEEVAAVGGLLLEEFSEDTSALVETGPTFEIIGDDAGEWVDLSSSDAQWRGGDQMCLIGEELFFLQNVVATATEGVYQLVGLIRARYGTAQATHEIDSAVYIFSFDEMEIHNKAWLLPGQDLYVKTAPYNNTSTVELGDVEAVVVDPYKGGGYRPLPPENLNTTDDTNAWVSGGDVELRWDYKNASSTSGAGVSVSDVVTQLALPEGYFKLTILNGTTVVREEFEILSNTFTYTQAMMAADFGSEPSSFNVEVAEILNGLTSEVDAATISVV